MGKIKVLMEMWEFLRMNKKYWLLPIFLLLLLTGLIIVVTEGSAIAPFIYMFF